MEAHGEWWEDIPERVEPGWLAVSFILRDHFDRTGKCYPELLDAEVFARLAVHPDAPRTASAQVSALLAAVDREARFVGASTSAAPLPVWAARTGLPGGDQVRAVVEYATSQLWVRLVGWGSGNDSPNFMLLPAGAMEAERNRHRAITRVDQVFVAMWFHVGMDAAFESGIGPAIQEDCRLRPYRVDRAVHSDRIDDRIIAEIRRSRALVADVTGERTGVYYEAGFAHGLGLPVIWTCNNAWISRFPKAVEPEAEPPGEWIQARWSERLHFDTRQFHHIFWSTPGDLRQKLSMRLRALGLALDR